MDAKDKAPLAEFRDVSRSFQQKGALFGPRKELYAVRDLSLTLHAGQTLGVVGESGCGKSTLGRMAVGLLRPDKGEVLVHGKSLFNESAHTDYKAFRASLHGTVQMVFQDSQSSLNPRMRVGESVGEPLRFCPRFSSLSSAERTARVEDMLALVGLEKEAALRYPHEFSGGQRQRIAVARALVAEPEFVVCDEPTSSLDASIQAQVLNLLSDLQERFGPAYLFISHDLAVVRQMSDRTAVMYRGLLVEEGDSASVFDAPLHPYTRCLLDALPENDGAGEAFPRSVKSIDLPLACCPYYPRCPRQTEECRRSLPSLLPSASETPNRKIRCFHPLA